MNCCSLFLLTEIQKALPKSYTFISAFLDFWTYVVNFIYYIMKMMPFYIITPNKNNAIK